MLTAIIEPEPLRRAGIHRLLFREYPQDHYIAEFDKIKDFEQTLVDRSRKTKFDVVIIGDIPSTPTQRASHIQHWSTDYPDMLIVVFGQQHSHTGVKLAQKAGAHIILDSRDFSEDTIPMLFAHCKNSQVLSYHVSEMLYEREYEAKQLQLKQLDIDVLHSLAEGYCNTEIMARFGMNRRKLYRIRIRLRTALNVKTDAQIVDTARLRGLI